MKKRGFTLLEMMVVVAIVGIMSSLAATGIQQVIMLGRVNGAANSVSRMLANGRMRALAMACRTSIQFNGPNYQPSGMPGGFPYEKNSVTVFQKANCGADSTKGAFENPDVNGLSDRTIATFSLSDQNVKTGVPTSILPAGVLDNDAIIVTFGVDVDGVFKRDAYVDASGGGAFTQIPAATLPGDLTFSFAAMSGNASRSAILPAFGAAYVEQ